MSQLSATVTGATGLSRAAAAGVGAGNTRAWEVREVPGARMGDDGRCRQHRRQRQQLHLTLHSTSHLKAASALEISSRHRPLSNQLAIASRRATDTRCSVYVGKCMSNDLCIGNWQQTSTWRCTCTCKNAPVSACKRTRCFCCELLLSVWDCSTLRLLCALRATWQGCAQVENCNTLNADLQVRTLAIIAALRSAWHHF